MFRNLLTNTTLELGKRLSSTSCKTKTLSRPVKVFSVKKVRDLFHVKGVDHYTEILTDQAKQAQGYKCSEYYWKYPEFNYENVSDETEYTLVTESEWNDIQDWNKWLESPDRQKIQEEYNEFFSSIEHIVLQKKPEVTSFTL